MYSVAPYFMAKTLMDIPVLLFTPFMEAIITYFGLGLVLTFGQFMGFYFIFCLEAQVAASIGYFISSIFDNEQMA